MIIILFVWFQQQYCPFKVLSQINNTYQRNHLMILHSHQLLGFQQQYLILNTIALIVLLDISFD